MFQLVLPKGNGLFLHSALWGNTSNSLMSHSYVLYRHTKVRKRSDSHWNITPGRAWIPHVSVKYLHRQLLDVYKMKDSFFCGKFLTEVRGFVWYVHKVPVSCLDHPCLISADKSRVVRACRATYHVRTM